MLTVRRPPKTATDIPTTLKKDMSVSRLQHITKIGVEDMGDLADSLNDPDVLRLENLDTDLRPPASALAHSKHAVDDDDANSYLAFFGLDAMRQAAVGLVGRQSGQEYDRNYVRLVWSNEPVDRLHGVGRRFREALT